jgi:Zn-dependent protease
MNTSPEITFADLLAFLAVLVLSTACHEFAHAWCADRFGDDTPRRAGRISFNPFVHIHPIYTVLLPAVMFWSSQGNSFMAAAWTPVQRANMRHPRVHGLLTALAGPATNLALAALFFIVLAVFLLAVGGIEPGGPVTRNVAFAMFLNMAVKMNLFLSIFNFLPIPPLDGSDLVAFVLPASLRVRWYEARRYAWVGFLVLMMTGVLNLVLDPPMRLADDAVGLGLHLVNGVALGR